MKDLESINNVDLIENNLKHIQYEFSLEKPSYFRIAIESHNVLLRAMVQSLKGGSNSFIDKKLNKERKFTFPINNSYQVRIKKQKVEGCTNAWRFSNPIKINPEEVGETVSRNNDNYEKYLAGYYDLLAMIQSDHFMKNFSGAETIIITNEDLRLLDWLHREIRNEYEHFIPKSYGASINDLICTSILCINICKKLLVESSNVYLLNLRYRFKNQLEDINNRFNSLTLKSI